MIAWLAFYVVLTACSLGALYPMLRAPDYLAEVAPTRDFPSIPDTTHDWRGLV